MTLSLPRLSDQLREIQTNAETIQKRVSGSWTTITTDSQGQITTRLRAAVQILYAEGLEGEAYRIFVNHLVPRCFTEMNAIAANNFSGIAIAPTPYKGEYAIRVLKAIHKTAGVLLENQQWLDATVSHNDWGIHNKTTTPELIKILKQIVDRRFANLPEGCFEQGIHQKPLQDVLSDVQNLIQKTKMTETRPTFVTNRTSANPLYGFEILTGKPCVLPLWKGISIKVGGGKAEEILGPVDHLDTSILRCIDSSVILSDNPKYTLEIYQNLDVKAYFDTLSTAIPQMPPEIVTLIINYLPQFTKTQWEKFCLDSTPYDNYRVEPCQSPITVNHLTAFNDQMAEFNKTGREPKTSGKWLARTPLMGDVAHITLMKPRQQEMLLVMRENRPLMCYPAEKIQNANIPTDYTISSRGMEVVEFQVLGDQIKINGSKARITTVDDLAPVSHETIT